MRDMSLTWLEMNRQTLRLLDEVSALLDEIHAFPFWAGPWTGPSALQVQLAQTLVELNLVVANAQVCRRMIEFTWTSVPVDLPEAFYPVEFDETAMNLLLAGEQLRASMVVLLTRFRALYEQSRGAM